MPNDTFTQQALANDPVFRVRFKASLARIAFQIMNEVGTTQNHTARRDFAAKVIANPDQYVTNLIGFFVHRTNPMGFTTTAGFDGRGGVIVQSAMADADIDSQLNTDWNNLSGV